MQSLSTFFEDNKPLAFVIIFAALLVLIIVLFLLYRVMFGRRLRTSAGGRTRQPRLGIVDAFDLDRQRQLVLVRRDNVEHLIMVGGPNDVLLESSIVRAQSVASVPPGRDKDIVVPTGAAAPQIPVAPPLTAPPLAPSPLGPPPVPPVAAQRTSGQAPSIPSAGGLPVPPPAPAVERRPAPAEDSAPSPRPVQPVAPARSTPFTPSPRPASPASADGIPPRSPASPIPARPVPPPRPASSLPPRPPLPPRPIRPAPPPPPRPDAVPTGSGQIRGEAPPLGGVTPGGNAAEPVAPAQDNAPPIAPENGSRPNVPSPGNLGAVQPTRSSESDHAASRPEQPPAKGLDTLESLEEEMAKLLGRTTPRRDG